MPGKDTNFWRTLPRPFFVQAPMEDVTDAAFRALFVEYGKPHVMWTEFTSADGLLLAEGHGKEKLLSKLRYTGGERPIVAQLFTHSLEHMERASALCASLGFDGIDINMGCPDKKVEKQGCGAALIKNPAHACALIRAAKKGAPKLPISVKTRVGYRSDAELPEWIGALLKEGVAALTIHARTRKDMSLVPARWHLVKETVALRDALGVETVIIGNGDAASLAEARMRVEETGCDGVMLGRAIFGNPWLFAEHVPSKEERVAGLIRHLELFDEYLAGITNFATMKKHFKSYITGWNHAKDLRSVLMGTSGVEEALALLRGYNFPEE